MFEVKLAKDLPNLDTLHDVVISVIDLTLDMGGLETGLQLCVFFVHDLFNLVKNDLQFGIADVQIIKLLVLKCHKLVEGEDLSAQERL